jgi:hypothetical protein
MSSDIAWDQKKQEDAMSNQGMYTVPKDRQAVKVHLDRGQVVDGIIFLEYAPQDHTAHQRVSDFLESADSFFPLALAEGAEPEFIFKRNLRMIEVVYPDRDPVFSSLIHLLPVTVQFVDQMILSGELMVDAPQEKSRLSDWLNTPHQFLCLRIGAKIYYVEKHSLRKVVYAEKR